MLSALGETRRAAVCSTPYIARIGRGPWRSHGGNRGGIAKRSSGGDPLRYGPSLQLENEGFPTDVLASFEKLPFNVLVMEDD